MFKNFSAICILLLLPLCCLPAPAQSSSPSFLAHMQTLQSSLVGVKTIYHKTIKTKTGPKQASYTRQGSGIIISAAGHIITNTHIIKNAPHIEITLNNGQTFPATVLLVSVDYDFSILRIKPPQALQPIPFADTTRLQLGEEIYAVGNSEFNKSSLLAGHVISLMQSRSTGAIEFIETDLNLYQGDSGGPIFNRQGQLVGMVMGKRQSKQRSALCIAASRIWEHYQWTLKRNNG